MVKVKEDCEQLSGGQSGSQQSNNHHSNNNNNNTAANNNNNNSTSHNNHRNSHHHGSEHEGKIPRSGTSNLATQHFHYHWSYPTAGPLPAGQATFHFGPGFEPQTAPNQHVVYFHVNPGVTVSFQMGDNVQTIKGPMTVPMVSTNSSPPIAMPVQVPHGHVVQQIVDESGTLRHVILSPQHPPLLPLPQHFGAGNPSGSNQPQGFYPGALPHGYHSAFSPLPAGVLGHGPPQGHSPPPHFHKDERSQRQYIKLKKKFEAKQQREHPLNTTPPLSPRKELNGNSKKGVGSVGTSEDGEESSSLQDEEEDMNLLTELLGNINVPQVSEVTSRTALVQWSAPKLDNPQDLNYDVLLSDKGKEGKYKPIYSGGALSCRIEDLKPGTEYLVCVSARLDNAVGCASEPTLFTTPPCKPDPPPAPKLAGRNRHSLTLKWLHAKDNGSPIERYVVENELNGNWTEITQTKSKQTIISKLQPATSYTFRIAAVNQYGKSDYSPSVEYHTCDSPPPQPLPVTLVHATPTTLTLQWQARPQDDEFTLQMEEPDSDHGYLAAYSGKETSYTCHSLKKNARYKFRLKSQNEDGFSKWSEESVFSTLPGRPGPPGRPGIDGKLHGQRCKLKWDPPFDKGGSSISNYTLEISKVKEGSEYKVAYSGAVNSCTVDRLEPGSKHSARVFCEGPGGRSEYSEVYIIATDPVCPGQCQPPRLHGKPKPHSVHIKWSYPENDGGSPVTEMEVAVCKRVEGNEEMVTAYKGKETECVVNDLCPAQNYTLTVRAINKIGRGAWSNALKVTSGSCAPSRPSAPNLTLMTGAVSCSWATPDSNGSPITQYVLQMMTPPCESHTPVFTGLATQCDVKPVPPATLCLFRLQAVNALGASLWSELSSIVTSPSTPGTIPALKHTATPTSISLSWGVPVANGDPVTHYIVDCGDNSTTVLETNYVIENLVPATQYRIKVRGVNGVGPGSVSTLKVSTLPLPPLPPQLTCATVGHNYLKLRWGAQNSNVHNYTFAVVMASPSGRRTTIYEGTNTSCKVSRLQEQTDYNFTISSANTTGKGPESELYTFTTCIAPPPYVKGLKAANISHRSCNIEWAPLKPQGNDRIDYTLQCARLREQVFKQVYHGSEPHFEVKELDAGAEYLFRVCAVRQSPKGPVEGSYCQNINVSTPAIHHENPPQHCVRTNSNQVNGNRPLTDQQWAAIILSVFIVLALLVTCIIAHSLLY